MSRSGIYPHFDWGLQFLITVTQFGQTPGVHFSFSNANPHFKAMSYYQVFYLNYIKISRIISWLIIINLFDNCVSRLTLYTR